MHMDAQPRKAGGRLSREDQRRLGDILQRVYDDVLRQGVPDRFKDLLQELDERKEVAMPSAMGRAEERQSSETDRRLEAKGLEAKAFPHNKGSS